MSIQRDRKRLPNRLVAGILMAGMVWGSTLWAQPMGQGPEDQRRSQPQKNDQRRVGKGGAARKTAVRYPEPGEMVLAMPGGYDTLHYGGLAYIFQAGIFYIQDPGGFRVVAPPRGVVVQSLPVGFETVVVAGISYFVYAGVYYNLAATGYVVVDPPSAQADSAVAATASAAETGDVLVVDAELLNVRSGPSSNHSVVSRVRSGDTLTVQGTSDGWYYVLLPDGSYGWVMAKFTRLLLPEAQG